MVLGQILVEEPRFKNWRCNFKYHNFSTSLECKDKMKSHEQIGTKIMNKWKCNEIFGVSISGGLWFIPLGVVVI